MAAVGQRDVRIAQLLIRRGADVNASAGEGKTPLAIARQSGDAEMLDLLQRSGAR
jgi:ankyrin repeat protein